MAMETGNPDFKYEIACSQICGQGHFAMRMTLVVDEPEDYDAWLAEQKPYKEANPELFAAKEQAPAKLVSAEGEKVKKGEEKAAL